VTAKRNLKRRVRARAAKTGESYTTALRHFRPTSTGDEKTMSEDNLASTPGTTVPKRVRLAVAQTVLSEDPRDASALRESGREVRRLMREARELGARIVHFPEGALCSPGKFQLSSAGPAEVAEADWDRMRWDVLRAEAVETARYAGELGIWTVFGAPHRLTAPHRPHNSLYVIDDTGRLVTRYDERLLSHTKISYMYTPGAGPRTFEVDGVRFGCLLGIETHFPELFAEYERLDVDCVLFSTTGGPKPADSAMFAAEVLGLAATNSYWVSFALGARLAELAPSGVVSPAGEWQARCAANQSSAIAVADLDEGAENVEIAVFRARPWRRTARSGLYAQHLVEDARSADLTVI
jgi:predicted amidohydrolase